MKSSDANALAGRVILVTRPREQATGLARAIEKAGGHAEIFPAIEIQDLPPPPLLERLADFDLAIFVSPTAVAKAMAHLGHLPAPAAAVGAGTGRELERYGVRDVIAPASGADSEALLAELQNVAGERILIVRGQGGRALLGDTLRARGATVEYAECYRRVRPQRTWSGRADAITVSSAEGLSNLFHMVDAALLQATPLFVPHERIAESARGRSVREVVVAGPSDEEMAASLMAYFAVHD
jgi:uroporphyrinogen-III synthase